MDSIVSIIMTCKAAAVCFFYGDRFVVKGLDMIRARPMAEELCVVQSKLNRPKLGRGPDFTAVPNNPMAYTQVFEIAVEGHEEEDAVTQFLTPLATDISSDVRPKAWELCNMVSGRLHRPVYGRICVTYSDITTDAFELDDVVCIRDSDEFSALM